MRIYEIQNITEKNRCIVDDSFCKVINYSNFIQFCRNKFSLLIRSLFFRSIVLKLIVQKKIINCPVAK